jgi:hypothetical protein
MAGFFRNIQFCEHFAQTAQLGMPCRRQANLLFASVLTEAVVQFHQPGGFELP